MLLLILYFCLFIIDAHTLNDNNNPREFQISLAYRHHFLHLTIKYGVELFYCHTCIAHIPLYLLYFILHAEFIVYFVATTCNAL